MRHYLPVLVLGILIGFAVGWGVKPRTTSSSDADATISRGPSSKSKSTRRTGYHQRDYQWFPKGERAFIAPRTDEERAEIRRLVRAGIEQKQFPARMKAVADLLAMMTPENAHDIRDAFKESWDAGYDFTWERSLFFARYGEVMGAEGAEEFIDHGEFGRLVVSWAQSSPADAVAWVNGLPPGRTRDEAVNRVMFGVGQLDPDYGLEVFESLAPEDRTRNQRNLVDAFRRAGGAKETTRLAAELLSREEEGLNQVGEYALHRTFSILKEGDSEELVAWLRSLPEQHMDLLDPNRLPEEFRPQPPAAND